MFISIETLKYMNKSPDNVTWVDSASVDAIRPGNRGFESEIILKSGLRFDSPVPVTEILKRLTAEDW